MAKVLDGEKIVETKKCTVSGEDFFVTDKDMAFYEAVSPIFRGTKYQVPSPTLSPIERQRRRLMFRNERKLYHRKCDATGKQVVSNYSADKPFPIFQKDYWMSDQHNPIEYGISFNTDETFMSQMKRLSDATPRLHAQQWVPVENSDYSNYVSNTKNCYLVFDSDFNEDCMYCNVTNDLKDCVDCSIVEKCRNCFECYNCSESHYLYFSSNSVSCRESWFLDNCIGCEQCALCVNLRNKKYCFENKQLTKEEYEVKLASLVGNSQVRDFRAKFQEFTSKFPHKHYQGTQTENMTGDRVVNGKNIKECFGIYECEDLAYCDLLLRCKNCMDVSSFGSGISWVYEGSTIGLDSQNCLFGCTNIQNCSNLLYCYISHSARNCFGCIGIKQGTEHCILNTSYSAHEYEQNAAKIIEHMQATGEWGEFFDHDLSPFGYNETVANEYLPLSKDDVVMKGWGWKEDDETTSYHGDTYSPLPIDQYNEGKVGSEVAKQNIDACVQGVHLCKDSGRPFKVIAQELAYYIQNGIALPTQHPDQRHKERMSIGNPRKLWTRKCAACGCEIETTYDPARPDRILCEECYRKEVS